MGFVPDSPKSALPRSPLASMLLSPRTPWLSSVWTPQWHRTLMPMPPGHAPLAGLWGTILPDFLPSMAPCSPCPAFTVQLPRAPSQASPHLPPRSQPHTLPWRRGSPLSPGLLGCLPFRLGRPNAPMPQGYLTATGQNRTLSSSGGTATWENRSAVSYKVKHTFSYDPTIPHPGIHSREMKAYAHTQTFTRMFRAALFIEAFILPQTGSN